MLAYFLCPVVFDHSHDKCVCRREREERECVCVCVWDKGWCSWSANRKFILIGTICLLSVLINLLFKMDGTRSWKQVMPWSFTYAQTQAPHAYTFTHPERSHTHTLSVSLSHTHSWLDLDGMCLEGMVSKQGISHQSTGDRQMLTSMPEAWRRVEKRT